MSLMGRAALLRIIFAITIVALWSVPRSNGARAASPKTFQIQGVVQSEAGELIADCLIMDNRVNWVTTDQDGRCSLKVSSDLETPEVTAFRAKGYMPLILKTAVEQAIPGASG